MKIEDEAAAVLNFIVKAKFNYGLSRELWFASWCATSRPAREVDSVMEWPPGPCLSLRCGQTAKWIQMPLGTEEGLGPGNIVLDGTPAPPTERGTSAPQFSAHVYCVQTAG